MKISHQFKMPNKHVFFKDNKHVFCRLDISHLHFSTIRSHERPNVKEFELVKVE